MKLVEIKNINPELIQILTAVWENSVKATHSFLTDEEIKAIKNYVPEAISGVQHLVLAETKDNVPIGFMGINGQNLEMLFISNNYRGQGVGTRLFDYGIKKYSVNTLSVNEQNPLARGFYEHMGFEVYKRSELDEQGNSFPILYLKRS